MNIAQDCREKKQIKTAIKKVNKTPGETLKELGAGPGNKFTAEVNAFIEEYRIALKRLAKK